MRRWVNQKNIQGNTSIHYACYLGDIKILETLHQLGANLDAINNDGQSCLHVAA